MGLFGDISRTLFGGSKQKSESGNKFADDIKAAFMPGAESFGSSMGAASNIMGLGGPEARSDALESWWGSSGGDFMLNQGLDNVDAFMRSKGLGQSGAAMKAMEDYRSGLASTKMSEAMNNLFNIGRLGLGAGGLVSGAGQYSEGSGSSQKGMGQFIGALLASDPRLKTNIEKVGEEPDGLGIYDYDYLPIEGQIADYMPPGRQRGVMADEVAELRPWALGPVVDGYRTVNYGAL